MHGTCEPMGDCKRLGIVRLSGKLLAELLGYPGHEVIEIERKFADTHISLKVSGPEMPLVAEGCEIRWVDIPAR